MRPVKSRAWLSKAIEATEQRERRHDRELPPEVIHQVAG